MKIHQEKNKQNWTKQVHFFFLFLQAKVSMKNTHIICKLEDLFNNILDVEEPTPSLNKCAHNLQDTLSLLKTWQT